jgi:hypothetical protein
VYGVPADLDLTQFVGASLVSVCLGEFNVVFRFQSQASSWPSAGPSLTVEGSWELRDRDGRQVDRSLPNDEREAYRVHGLLGRPVERFVVNAPDSIVLVFDGGQELQVYDDSADFESFQIQPGDIIV